MALLPWLWFEDEMTPVATRTPNQSVNRSWLAFRFLEVISFDYVFWLFKVSRVGPPTRLPRPLRD